MAQNLVDIIIVVVLLFSLIAGMYKGFIASGLSALGFVAAWFGAMYLFPFLANSLEGNASLMGVLSYYLDADSLFKLPAVANTLVSDALKNGQLTQALADLHLPVILKNAFQTNVASQQFAGIGLHTLTEYLNQTIISSLINVLSFLVMFIVSYTLVVLFINLLNAVFRFPLLRHLDGILGGIFGLARGVVVVMLILATVPLLESMIQIDIVEKAIAQSTIAQYFPQDFAIPDIIRRAFQELGMM